MKCGKGHDHPDMAGVRACYAERYGWDPRTLQAEIDLGTRKIPDVAMVVRGEAAATRNGASREDLRQARQASAADLRRPGACDLEPGGYAVPSRTGRNDLDFWWLDRPGAGKWDGWTFASRVIGGHPDQRVSRGEQKEALARLMALSPAERADARSRFGRELGNCYVCGRTLTDEASRAAGIGPVCASR